MRHDTAGAPQARIGLDRLYTAAAQRAVVVKTNCRYSPQRRAASCDEQPRRNGGWDGVR